MKGKYGGPMPIDNLFQALFEDRDFFKEHGITHVRSTFLYFTPCDARGRAVTVTDQEGHILDGYESAGGYHSAADDYEAESIEVCPITRAIYH